jgi:uncharacterized protein (DUF885 family)
MTQEGPESRGVGDAQFEALISSRFDALMETWPSQATYLGIHQYDGQLADLSRAAKEADLAAERRFIDKLEATDPSTLSESQRFERDVALHGARLRLFEGEVVRGWERRTSATDEIGDALFLLLARDFAPFEERLGSMTQRIEAIPTALMQVRDCLGDEPVRLWMELEKVAAAELPQLVHQIVTTAQGVWPSGSTELRRLMTAAPAARAALLDYSAWIEQQLKRSGTRVALGADQLDELIGLRAFDGLDVDDILAIGLEQLEAMHEVRREAGRAIDPALSETEIMDLVKADGPADFDAALAGYRDAMLRARRYIAEHDLATLPAGDVIEVVPTPAHMRSTIPLAAYFEPAAFDRPIRGVYIVTPSVDGDPGAMNEHNWSSIVNTSVHEAYPGHHLQFAAALTSPTPARLLTDAPEFHEGWGMYCEQMMLEEGFEDTPQRRVIVATDAIWRACRIILDIGLHRGEMSVDEAIEFLVEHTRFERPVARAEVYRYTQTPGYNLSYLLGKVLLLRLRDDEQKRLGDAFTLKGYHDALLYSGSLPVSFHRRLLAGEGGGPARPGQNRSG